MLAMKHNGTVEKAAIGMGMLASVLMHTASPALNALPGLWMDRCLARVVEAGQCRDDVTRRWAVKGAVWWWPWSQEVIRGDSVCGGVGDFQACSSDWTAVLGTSVCELRHRSFVGCGC